MYQAVPAYGGISVVAGTKEKNITRYVLLVGQMALDMSAIFISGESAWI
jgi:hypothetical protein